MHQPRKPSIHHFVRSIVMFGASLLVVTSPLHAATGGGKASGELLPPNGASKVATAKTGDPGWLMVMMMTHPNVRATVLGAKATAAPVGWSPAVVAKRLNHCGNRSTATTASSGKTAGAATIPAASALKPKKVAKKTRLALLGRPHAMVPASDRSSFATRKKQLAALVSAAKQLKGGAPADASTGAKAAPKLMKPTAWPATK